MLRCHYIANGKKYKESQGRSAARAAEKTKTVVDRVCTGCHYIVKASNGAHYSADTLVKAKKSAKRHSGTIKKVCLKGGKVSSEKNVR